MATQQVIESVGNPKQIAIENLGFVKEEWGFSNEFNFKNDFLEIYIRYDDSMCEIEDMIIQDKIVQNDHLHLYTIPRIEAIIKALDLTQEAA